jgi:hypothetical protein
MKKRISTDFLLYCPMSESDERFTLHPVKCPNPDCKKEFQLKRPVKLGFSQIDLIQIKCPHCGLTFRSEKPMV